MNGLCLLERPGQGQVGEPDFGEILDNTSAVRNLADGLRKSLKGRGALDDGLDQEQFIELDPGRFLRQYQGKEHEAFLEKYDVPDLATFLAYFGRIYYHDVWVDYDARDAIRLAILAADLEIAGFSEMLEVVPLVGRGRVHRTVYEVNFGIMIKFGEVPEELIRRGELFGIKGGFKQADPLTSLCFAAAKPKRLTSNNYYLQSFTDHLGKMYGLKFDALVAGRRNLEIFESVPDAIWRQGARFPAIAAF